MDSLKHAMETVCGISPPGNPPRPTTAPSHAPDTLLDIGPFTEITKLRGTENWKEWHQQISTEFQRQGVWHIVINRRNLDRSDPPYGLDFSTWKRLDNSLTALLTMTVCRELMVDLPDVGITRTYLHLSEKYTPRPTFSQLVKKLSGLHLDNFPCVADYTQAFVDLYEELLAVRLAAVSAEMVLALFLEGLGPEWEDLRMKMMEDTEENRRLPPQQVMRMVSAKAGAEQSAEDETCTAVEASSDTQIPAEHDVPSKRDIPAIEKKSEEEAKPVGEEFSSDYSDEDMFFDDDTSSDEEMPYGQGVPTWKELIPAKQVMPMPAREYMPANQKMHEEEEESSDEDTSSDEDMPYYQVVPALKEDLPIKEVIPAPEQIRANQNMPDEEMSSDEDMSSDDDLSTDEERYSTGHRPTGQHAERTVQLGAHSNRPFCGHCNVVGHRQAGCWRRAGKTDEEIRQMRFKLSERRKKRRMRGRSPKAIVPPVNSSYTYTVPPAIVTY